MSGAKHHSEGADWGTGPELEPTPDLVRDAIAVLDQGQEGGGRAGAYVIHVLAHTFDQSATVSAAEVIDVLDGMLDRGEIVQPTRTTVRLADDDSENEEGDR